MTIYTQNKKGEWIWMIDNIKFIGRIRIWLAFNRSWQLITTPRHIILGFYYKYDWNSEIKPFVQEHIKQWW